MWFFFTFGLAFLLLGLVLFLDGLRRERALARDWQLILTPRGEESYRSLKDQVQAELELADLTYQQATQARERGDIEQAMRLMDSGCELIEAFAPRMVRALAAMSVLSRMASAIAPVRPLRPADFRLSQLVHLAYVSKFLHHLLVSTAERFRLRVYLLQRGFRTIGGLAFRWRREPVFEGLHDVKHDVVTLSDESLLTFRTLLVSLAAERRAS